MFQQILDLNDADLTRREILDLEDGAFSLELVLVMLNGSVRTEVQYKKVIDRWYF